MISDFCSFLHRGASAAFSCSISVLSYSMALFFILWHYLVIRVALDIQGHPWILVFQVVLGYLVNLSPLEIQQVLKEKKRKSIATERLKMYREQSSLC